MIELKQLRHFVALAETLNYRAAAERLHMTQPPLSASIRNMEEFLGSPLFERSRRGTRLTPAGTAALNMARRTLSSAGQFESTVHDVAAGLAGTLAIGYVASTAYHVLPKVLPLFRKAYPKVQLRLVEQTSERVLELVEQRALDLGLMRTPLAGPTSVTLKIFLKEPFLAALPDTAHWKDRKMVNISELAREPFVSYESPYAQSLAMLICQQAGFTPKIAQKASGLPTVVSLVKCGLGVALVPAVARLWPTPGVVFKSLRGVASGMEMGLAMAWQPDAPSPLVTRFQEMINAAFLPAPESALK